MELFYVYFAGILVLIPILVIGGIVGARMNSVFSKHAEHIIQDDDALNLTIKIMQDNAIDDVTIAEINSENTNCYNAKHRIIKLSSSVIHSNTVTACGVSMYTVGTAKIEHENPRKIRLRQNIHLATSFISKCFLPILLVGTIITFFLELETFGTIISWIITIAYFLSLIAELILLPLDIKAEKQAMSYIDSINNLSFDNRKNISSVIHFCRFLNLVDFANSIIYCLKIFVLAFKVTDKSTKKPI